MSVLSLPKMSSERNGSGSCKRRQNAWRKKLWGCLQYVPFKAQVQETQEEPKPEVSDYEAADELLAWYGEDGLTKVCVPVR